MLTALFVLTRIIANPVSNVFQKQLAERDVSPVFIIGVTHAWLTLIAIPWIGFLPTHLLGHAFWVNIIICAVLAVAGNVLLVFALKAAELSLLGPINAYKAVLSLVLGVFLIGEVPTVYGLFGVLLVLAGSYGLVERLPNESRRKAVTLFYRERGVKFRFLALAFTATEAVFLKRAILHSSPLVAFLFWAVLGLPVSLVAVVVLLRGTITQELFRFKKHAKTFLWLALTTGLMQFSTLLTFDTMQVSYALSLFQLSAVVSVFLGYRFFNERYLIKRLVASSIMVLGSVLIVILGRRS
jgi:drug/metabolite transporter (DMT)-like permease